MAIVYATKSGNWSDTTVWNSGSLPNTGDDVYSGPYQILINQNVTVNSIRNTSNASPAITAGGFFNMSANTVNVGTLFHSPGSSVLIQTYNPTGTTITINSTNPISGNTASQACIIMGANLQGGNVNITAPSVTNSVVSAFGIANVYTGNLTFVGNANGGSVIGAAITIQNGTVNITGNVNGGNVNLSYGLSMTNSTISATITGNVNGGTVANNGYGVNLTSGNLSIIGNVSANGNANAINSTVGNITIAGNVTTTISSAAIATTSIGTMTVIGTITASSSSPAITSSSLSATNIFSGPLINNTQRMAVYSPKMYLSTSSTYWTIFNAAASNKSLFTDDQLSGIPSIANVRSGIVYGASSGLTGTMVVPTPANVRKGVLTDNTVGTGELTANDFLNAITASTNPMAVRLANISTVSTTGSQLASYNI